MRTRGRKLRVLYVGTTVGCELVFGCVTRTSFCKSFCKSSWMMNRTLLVVKVFYPLEIVKFVSFVNVDVLKKDTNVVVHVQCPQRKKIDCVTIGYKIGRRS